MKSKVRFGEYENLVPSKELNRAIEQLLIGKQYAEVCLYCGCKTKENYINCPHCGAGY